jgi:hypothetical protein
LSVQPSDGNEARGIIILRVLPSHPVPLIICVVAVSIVHRYHSLAPSMPPATATALYQEMLSEPHPLLRHLTCRPLRGTRADSVVGADEVKSLFPTANYPMLTRLRWLSCAGRFWAAAS